jgi:hypothetical protein
MASPLTRCALVAVALLAGAWLVVGVRATGLESDATHVLAKAARGRISAAEAQHAKDLLRRARLLSVDEGPRLSEGILLGQTGRLRQWVSLAERVVLDEPDNYDGWRYLYLASLAAHDPRRAAKALARIRVLNPVAAAALEPQG